MLNSRIRQLETQALKIEKAIKIKEAEQVNLLNQHERICKELAQMERANVK